MPTGYGRRLEGVGAIFFCKALVFSSYLLNLKNSEAWCNVGLSKQGIVQPEEDEVLWEVLPQSPAV